MPRSCSNPVSGNSSTTGSRRGGRRSKRSCARTSSGATGCFSPERALRPISAMRWFRPSRVRSSRGRRRFPRPTSSPIRPPGSLRGATCCSCRSPVRATVPRASALSSWPTGWEESGSRISSLPATPKGGWPGETDDRSLAMTSSFSTMLLTALLVSRIDRIGGDAAAVECLANQTARALETYDSRIAAVARRNFSRAVFLGSGAL